MEAYSLACLGWSGQRGSQGRQTEATRLHPSNASSGEWVVAGVGGLGDQRGGS